MARYCRQSTLHGYVVDAHSKGYRDYWGNRAKAAAV